MPKTRRWRLAGLVSRGSDTGGQHQVSQDERRLICSGLMYSVPFKQNVSLKRAGIITFCSLRSVPGTVSVQWTSLLNKSSIQSSDIFKNKGHKGLQQNKNNNNHVIFITLATITIYWALTLSQTLWPIISTVLTSKREALLSSSQVYRFTYWINNLPQVTKQHSWNRGLLTPRPSSHLLCHICRMANTLLTQR